MAGFLYYVPNRAGIDLDGIKAIGLDNRIGPAMMTRQCCGPDGKQGLIVIHGETGDCHYRPEAQVWKPVGEIGSPRYWYGWNWKTPPGEADLRRDAVEGNPAALANGETWISGVLYCAAQGIAMGRRMRFAAGPDGSWRQELPRRWEAAAAMVMDMLARVLEGTASGDGATFTTEETLDLAEEALQENYRISRHEIGALGLVDAGSLDLLVAAALDLNGLKDLLQKKTLSAPPDTTTGAPE